MNISQKGIDLIKKYEGCRLRAYKCPAGIWTIGYGHTNGVKSGMVITMAQAEEYLKQDIQKYESHVMGYDARYHWTQNEFDALVSFAYNVGNIIGLTSYGTRSKGQILEKMGLYVKAKGTTLPGLIKRRQEEQHMFMCVDPLQIVARDVINGKYGNGKERTAALKAKGYNPKEVQKIVNQILKT